MKGLRLKRKLRQVKVDTAKDVKGANPSTGGFPNIKKTDTTANLPDSIGASMQKLRDTRDDYGAKKLGGVAKKAKKLRRKPKKGDNAFSLKKGYYKAEDERKKGRTGE
jgi:hypothetical protein